MRWLAVVALVAPAAGCGQSPLLDVEINLDGRVVPDDVTSLHLVLWKNNDSWVRDVDLPAGAGPFVVELVLGTELRGRVLLEVTAFKDQDLVGVAPDLLIDLDAPPANAEMSVVIPL